jgi:hypothetical protein
VGEYAVYQHERFEEYEQAFKSAGIHLIVIPKSFIEEEEKAEDLRENWQNFWLWRRICEIVD